MKKQFVKEIREHVKLYRDPESGLAWIEDGTVGVEISVHANIDAKCTVGAMKKRGSWRKEDRIVTCAGWHFNIDTLIYDQRDDLNLIVLNECNCDACRERRSRKKA